MEQKKKINLNDNVKNENSLEIKSKPNLFSILKSVDISPMEFLDFPIYQLSDSQKITLILTWRAIEEARRRQHKDGKRFQPQ